MNQDYLKLMEFLKPYQTHERPKIICLCGSTRFYSTFLEQNYLETMKGNIVLSVGFYPHAQNEMHGKSVGITKEQKDCLDQLHFRKIDLADEVFVLNVDGYIGESTANEIVYASMKGKPIRFLDDSKLCFSKPSHFAVSLLGVNS